MASAQRAICTSYTQVERIIGAVHGSDYCGSPERHIWFGSPSADVQEHVRPIFQIRPDAARGYLGGVLANRLYGDFYQAGRARPSRAPYAGATRANGLAEYVEALSEANAGNGTRQAGWIVVGHREADENDFDTGDGSSCVKPEGQATFTDESNSGECSCDSPDSTTTAANTDPATTQPSSEDESAVELLIQRDGLTLQAKPEEVVYEGDELPVVGTEVELKLPKELPAISPGFYTALSDEPYDATDRAVVRVYWNLYPWGAATLVREMTELLNGAGLPFRLKLVNHPDRYNRCDAAVLYLLRDDLDRAVPHLQAVYRAVRDDLKRPVPGLTKRIAPGVGLAEDPPGGDSFGMHRCRLLAEGLIRGWERGLESVEERLAVVLETFEEAGIDPEKPYLNPGSVDDYDTSFDGGESRATGPVAPTGGRLAAFAEQDVLETAARIGAEIVGETFWHEGWCNWLGVEGRDPNAPAHQGMTYSSLGPESYGGSSGVALFLAELADATGDEEARKTALGAIRQALGRAEVIEPPVQLGLYTGRPGLALVAARVGNLLDAPDVLDGARALLGNLDADFDLEHEHDLLSGSAGGVLALLRLNELQDDSSLVDSATVLGDRLVAAAQRDERGCSWSSVALPESPNLTGFSHGAAGIGVALLELWRATGDNRFHDVATAAFDYERCWINPVEGNWPDLRTVDDLDERPNGPFPFATYWCHGAPGIALSRLRAWELTGDERYHDEAVTALNTTRQFVLDALEDGTVNYSLCHGLAGNAEVLTIGAEMLGEPFSDLAETARMVAAEGLRIYAPDGRDWPCGTHGGWTPNLMLGLAGIGRFYLRLARPELPSVLY